MAAKSIRTIPRSVGWTSQLEKVLKKKKAEIASSESSPDYVQRTLQASREYLREFQ
jgi:hypothetical protein